ncbi:MAG: 3'-5' exonuclease [Patescibacteria group bacterium]
MILVFDTETTGVPRDYSAPVTAVNNWPRMVQLAYQIHSDNGDLIGFCSRIVRPVGFTIPEHAAALHGITTERAMAEGWPLREVLEDFGACLNYHRPVLVAHSVNFDMKVVGAEMVREGLRAPLMSLMNLPRICTMMKTRTFCGLPGQKWPKLGELHEILFNEPIQGAHTANGDVEACARCFFELRRRGVLTLEAAERSAAV